MQSITQKLLLQTVQITPSTKGLLALLSKNSFATSNPQTIKELVGANPVRKFSLDFAKLQQQNPRCINLALGVPMDPTPKTIVDAKLDYVKFTGETGNNGYGDPRGIESLRKNLSASHRKNYKQTEQYLNENNIQIVPGGTSNAICLSLERILKDSNGEGEVLILAPFFGPYQGMVKLSRGNPVIVDTDSEFLPDLAAIEKAITKNTKAILINSPNNPTGKVYPESSIISILDLAKKHNLAVVSDEIYKKFAYIKEKPFHSLMEYFHLYPEQHLVVVNGASKTYGMIGDRLGTIVWNKPELIEDIAITLGYRFASSPYLPQVAYDSIFKNYDEIQKGLKEMNAFYKEKAEFLVEGLRKIGFNAMDLEGGMFVMTEVKSLTGLNGDELSQHFLQQDAPIAVYPGSFFGDSYKDFLRFTTCPTQETLQQGLDQIQVYVTELQAKRK